MIIVELQKLVVVGGVAAGLSAASAVKRKKPDVDVVVYERSPHISYASCGLPYFVSGIVPKRPQIFTKERLEKERNIRVFVRHEVFELDIEAKRVRVRDLETGAEKEDSFDVLVLATGGAPKMPPIDGLDLTGVHVVRTLQDGITMLEQVQSGSPKHGVILGGGYIGCEMAETLAEVGMHVHVVQRSDHFLGTINPEIGELVKEEFAKHDVDVQIEDVASEFIGENGHVTAVKTAAGRTVPADFVVISIGIKPESELAQQAGLEVGHTGGIKVNKHQQTSVPYVYAAGDCCEAWHLVKEDWDYIPLGTTANKQGRVAGNHIVDGTSAFGGIVGTAVTKIFDLGVARTGLSSVECERLGRDFFTTTIKQKSRAHYYPGGGPITVSLNVEPATGKLLGAAMAGIEGVAKRIDILATALHAGMTIADIQGLDLSYAPPFAPVWDAVLIAANVASKKVGR